MEQHKEHFVTDEVFKGKDLGKDLNMMEVEEVSQRMETGARQLTPSTPPEKAMDEHAKPLDHASEKPAK